MRRRGQRVQNSTQKTCLWWILLLLTIILFVTKHTHLPKYTHTSTHTKTKPVNSDDNKSKLGNRSFFYADCLLAFARQHQQQQQHFELGKWWLNFKKIHKKSNKKNCFFSWEGTNRGQTKKFANYNSFFSFMENDSNYIIRNPPSFLCLVKEKIPFIIVLPTRK